MDTSNNTTISKLVLLYVLDNMEIPLIEKSIVDICCSQNSWISYLTCKEVLIDLVETGFVLEISNNSGEKYYSITPDGRSCLSYFFSKIPISLRDEISAFVKDNRIQFKRQQEYSHDYYRNADNTYTVNVKIIEPLGTKLELKLNVANRAIAKQIAKLWTEKASDVYASIYNILIDD